MIKVHRDNLPNDWRKQLTVRADIDEDYSTFVPIVRCYSEIEDDVYVPKFWYKHINPTVDLFRETLPVDIDSSIELRQSQIPIAENILNWIRTEYGAVVSLNTGFGKTVIALWLAAQLKVKCLILVHTEVLRLQWGDNIRNFNDIEPGTIKGPIFDISSNICVGMIQTISMTKKEMDLSPFDFVVVDETHHIGSKVFSKVLKKINPLYSLGLSATPKRKDGLTKVFLWSLGPIIVENNGISDNIEPLRVKIINSDESLIMDTMRNDKPNIAKATTDLTKLENRNQLIIDAIEEAKRANRKILVVSERVAHCRLLAEAVGGFYYAAKSELDREAQVVVATKQLVSEGFDFPELDTLILATSWRDVKQVTGRILRRRNLNPPLVIDIRDRAIGLFCNQSYARSRFWKSLKEEETPFFPTLRDDI